MIRNTLLFFLLIGLFGCKTESKTVIYYGQIAPDSVPKIFAPNEVSLKGRLEQGFSISPDNQEILFGVIGNHDTLNCIYMTSIINDRLTKPIKPEFIDNDSVFFPMFSPDHKTITFTKRNANSMQTDIWYCEKKNDSWSKPKRYPSQINSQYREGSSCLMLNNTLYFTSNRDTLYGCCGDIYRSKFIDDKYDSVERLDNINSIFDEEGVFISPREDFIIIQSWKADYKTKHDLYISYQTKNNTWTNLERLDSSINTIDLEQRPFVTFDNKYLFFNRFALDSNFNAVESDIYWVSTKKIFKPFVYNSMPDTSVRLGHDFNIQIPLDLFKDIDNAILEYSIDLDKNMNTDWLHVDNKKRIVSGFPNQIGDYKITINATDKNGNHSSEFFNLTIKE